MRIGHVNDIPVMQVFTGVFRNTQSKSYTLSLTECVRKFRFNALKIIILNQVSAHYLYLSLPNDSSRAKMKCLESYSTILLTIYRIIGLIASVINCSASTFRIYDVIKTRV